MLFNLTSCDSGKVRAKPFSIKLGEYIMKLILTNDDDQVVEEWKINQDIDLPDLEELMSCLHDNGFYDDDQEILLGIKK